MSGTTSLLDPGVQLQIFHLLYFSFIGSLHFVGGRSVDQGAFTACSNNHVSVWPSFLVDIEFQFALATDVENVSCHSRFLRQVLVTCRFQRTRCCRCPFGHCPRPSGPACSRHHPPWSSALDPLNSNSGSAVVNLGPEQRHVSLPPLARFGDSSPTYLGALCISLRETSPVQEFRRHDIQAFCRCQTRKF